MPQVEAHSVPVPGTVVASGSLMAPSGSQGTGGPPGATGATGPIGPPGPTGVSTDAGNLAKLGTDGLTLVPTSAIPPLSKYYGADIGSSTAYVVNVNTDFQLVQGVVVFVVPANSSGASPTLNVNGTGAIGLVNRANAAITANQIVANTMFAVMYDGVKYRIFTPIP